jgi:two-component system invasion response regulator UvrY
MPKILLADDHEIIRSGIKMMIENFLPKSEIDEAGDGNIAFEKIKANKYDLIILDVNMPNTDSFGLISNILAVKPAAKILMFSMNSEEMYAKRYLKMGALGYIRKDKEESEIKKAIVAVMNNTRYLSKEMNDKILKDYFTDQADTNPFDRLSPREFEIVQQLIRGNSLADICEDLKLQSSTVGTYKARIFEKLGCTNIIELSDLARLHSIIT